MTAASKRRPTRAQLEALIREEGGNLSAVSRRLGVSRQTTYTWVYQLGLDRLAGIEPLEVVRAPAEPAETGRRFATLQLPAPLHRWARIHALNTDRSLSVVVAEALELLRAVVEREE